MENKKTKAKLAKIDKKLNKKYKPFVYEIFEQKIEKKRDNLEQQKQDLEKEL